MRFDHSDRLRAKSHVLIPGGCHAYAKADSEYPQLSPGFISRGEGCHVWDVDGNEFIEYAPGNRSVSLGHAYRPVIEAITDELQRGVNFTRPAEIELRAAEKLLSVLTNAEMVKFCKNGSDATSAAIRLSRAATGRDLIACCADHPFFAFDDWFIATTPHNGGIPETAKSLTLTFRYNDIDSVKTIFESHKNKVACLILEPARYEEPQDDFLSDLKQICHDHGTLLVFDEMITGFRWHLRGGQAVYGVDPDLACWGKAMANGFSVSALTGKRRYMELGDLSTRSNNLFLLSTTHGAETHSLAAMMATLDAYIDLPIIDTLYKQGQRLAEGFRRLVAEHHLGHAIEVIGRPCCLSYHTKDSSGQYSPLLRALLLQETIRRGILMSSLVVTYSHSDSDIDQTLAAIDGALGVYAKALREGTEKYLQGPSPRPIYRR
jgi:glutamate-1-semialdehyde 2,1-aminomutase